MWCQSVNFKIDYLSLIKLYPLDKVREIHISGGSWASVKSSKNKIRRDTHDDSVPNELFDILPKVLSLCKNVECVVFERLGNTFKNDADIKQFQNDFLKIKAIVAKVYADDKKQPSEELTKVKKVDRYKAQSLTDTTIQKQEKQLIKIFSANSSGEDVRIALNNNPLFADWRTNTWPVEMLETAMQIINKWG